MFGPDPIDWFDPSPYASIAYYAHLFIGALALIAAVVAFASRKGGGLHRKAGWVYMASCAVVCASSISMLAVVIIPPLMMAVLTSIYAIGGAYLALQDGTPKVRAAEKTLLGMEVAGLIAFLLMSIKVIMSGLLPFYAPLVIAIIPSILIVGDIHWLRNQDKRKSLRIARHLSRMIWGFIVVLRAPLVELAAGGYLPPAQMVYVLGPIILGFALIWYFQRRFGGSPFGRTA